MAHFAQIDENNIVKQVIVVDNEEIKDPLTGQEDEILGIAFCKKTFGGNWVQTSYNNRIRGVYAGVGFTYDKQRDIFMPPKPHPSWVYNAEECRWESPVGPCPPLTSEEREAGNHYFWIEESQEWQLK